MINIALILTKALSNKYIYSVFTAVPNLNLGTTVHTYWWLHWWMTAQMSLHLGPSETENKNLIFIISLSPPVLSTLIKCSLSPAASVGCKSVRVCSSTHRTRAHPWLLVTVATSGGCCCTGYRMQYEEELAGTQFISLRSRIFIQ